MKKVILLLMLLLPMGVGLQSCSDDDELSYYDQVLEAKIQMVNDFKTTYKGSKLVGVKVGDDNYYMVYIDTKEIEIVDGRYLKIGNSIFDLMHLIGYSRSSPTTTNVGYRFDCVLMFE